MITSLGSIGLGLVWGWLTANFNPQIARPYKVVLSIIVSTAVLSAEVFWLAGLSPVIDFLLVMVASLFLHSQGRKDLLKRQIQS